MENERDFQTGVIPTVWEKEPRPAPRAYYVGAAGIVCSAPEQVRQSDPEQDFD